MTRPESAEIEGLDFDDLPLSVLRKQDTLLEVGLLLHAVLEPNRSEIQVWINQDFWKFTITVITIHTSSLGKMTAARSLPERVKNVFDKMSFG